MSSKGAMAVQESKDREVQSFHNLMLDLDNCSLALPKFFIRAFAIESKPFPLGGFILPIQITIFWRALGFDFLTGDFTATAPTSTDSSNCSSCGE